MIRQGRYLPSLTTRRRRLDTFILSPAITTRLRLPLKQHPMASAVLLHQDKSLLTVCLSNNSAVLQRLFLPHSPCSPSRNGTLPRLHPFRPPEPLLHGLTTVLALMRRDHALEARGVIPKSFRRALGKPAPLILSLLVSRVLVATTPFVRRLCPIIPWQILRRPHDSQKTITTSAIVHVFDVPPSFRTIISLSRYS